MKLVFATNNIHKLKEVQEMLSNTIEVLSLKDIGCFEDVEDSDQNDQGIHRPRHKLDVLGWIKLPGSTVATGRGQHQPICW